MAQRDQAGYTLEQVQAHGENRHDHHARHHLGVKIGADEGEGD